MEFILPIVAVVLLGSIIITKRREGTLVLPLLVILGAGLHNYSDLIRFGYVRDPLSIGSFVFNVADIFILIGTCWAIWVYTRR